MSNKFISLLALTLSLSGCHSKPTPPKYEGLCSHPAVMGGMPFPLNEKVSYDRAHGTIETEMKDGTRVILLGAQCILHKK